MTSNKKKLNLSADMTSPSSPLRAWAEIDLSALEENFYYAQTCAQGAGIIAVVKADAYGHGLEKVCQRLEPLDIAYWAVANIGEARRLVSLGTRHHILLLGPTFPEEREEIVRQGWTPLIASLEDAAHFNQLAKLAQQKLPVHLAIDTGMGRGGFLPSFLREQAHLLLDYSHLIFEGLASHLPSADEDATFTQEQIALFQELCHFLRSLLPLKKYHLSNSVGLLDYTIPEVNLMRPGLMLYGYNPSPTQKHALRPALTLKSRVTTVHTLPAGHGVSYGRTFVTTRETQVATIGIGYADGYPRQLSSAGARVWIKGHTCPLLGRVTMDQIMVDVTELSDVCSGDEVELIGEHISVEEIAQKAQTIVWDILTGLGPRVVRLYKKG